MKTTMRYYHTPIRMTKIKKKIVTALNAGKDAEKVNYSYIAGGNVKLYSHSGKVLQFLIKVNMQLLYYSTIAL